MAIVPATLTPPVVLDPGVIVTLVNGATGTGTAASQQCGVQPRGDGGDHQLHLQAIKTGAFTALTADLEESTDGGTTFNAFAGGLDFNASAVAKITNLVAGNIYRLNIKSFAGGTSVVINESVS
jgi:hypothetical protein